MPRSSPFQARSLASNGVTYAVPVQTGSPIMDGLKTIMGSFGKAGQREETAAHSAYYRSEAEAKAAETARQASKDSAIQQATQDLQAELNQDAPDAEGAYRRFQMKVAPYYADKDGADGMRGLQMDSDALSAARPNATPFSRNVLSTFMAADGHALKDNEALTADENAGRFKRTQGAVEQKNTWEHGDRVLNITTDAKTQMRGQDVQAGTSRANNADDNKTRESEGYKDRYGRAYMESLDRQSRERGGGGGGNGYTSTTVKNDGAGNKTTSTTTRTPTPRAGPARAAAPVAKPDPMGLR